MSSRQRGSPRKSTVPGMGKRRQLQQEKFTESAIFQNSTINVMGSTTKMPFTAMVSFQGFATVKPSYATGTEEVFSGNSYAALQNQIIQTNTFGTSYNIASAQTHQDTKEIEEILRQIHYLYELPETYYPSSGGAPIPSEVNVSPGPVAYPATVGAVTTAGIETSFENHFNFNLQAGSALTNGLVFPPQTVASNTYASRTAYSSSVYPPYYNHAWATQPDLSAFGPEAQTVAPRMNTVTPCVVCYNDRGGASVGAAACAIAPAPGPTPNTNDNAHDMPPNSTASTNPPRDTEKRDHRSGQRTHAPRAMGYNWPRHSTSTPRGVPPSRAQTSKSPTVPYEADINILAARLLDEGAKPGTVEVLRTQVFNNGVTDRALTAKFIHVEQSTNHSRVKRKYLLLLEHSSKGYRCSLCPQDRPVKYKNSQDSLRHLRKVHFGLALICRCGW
jgi:hypothetical protein